MKQSLRILIGIFFFWILLFATAKLLFMACYHGLYTGLSIGDIADVLIHGIRMDNATAGYLTAFPALVLVVAPWLRTTRWVVVIIKWYLLVAVYVVVAILMVDTVLYGFWDFKLDVTPLFYFVSNPASAAPSVPAWHIALGLVAWIVVGRVLWSLALKLASLRHYTGGGNCRWGVSAVMLLLCGLLFVNIRGGVGVATINMSSAFYSDNMRLNHAAVNPAFSLLYSATHQTDFGRMFRILDEEEASALMSTITNTTPVAATDSCHRSLLSERARPDIYLIILESFSSHLFPSLGGDSIAVGLDSIASEGLVFSGLYSSTFRTDRALPAILCGFPSQPTTSLVRFPEKTRHLPSLAKSLASEGYEPVYYYGGDPTFANQLTFLMNTGFGKVIDDSDFDRALPRGKWGVDDEYLFEKVLSETVGQREHLQFNVVQTSSSHEPFDVPYESARWSHDRQANAFAYTDSCVTRFVNELSKRENWDNTLVVLVPDHWGCYPHDVDPMDVVSRHRVPLIMTGGALRLKGNVDRVASQVDIAATLLGEMGIDHKEFTFSRNILDCSTRPVAFMSTPVYSALVDSTGVASLYTIDTKRFGSERLSAADSLAGAYLQSVYTAIAGL